jgi:hypothetical protein
MDNLNFDIENGFAFEPTGSSNDLSSARKSPEPLSLAQIVRAHKCLPVFRPEGMIGGRADRGGETFDVKIENIR